jgi:dihydropteroate synthase
VVALVKESLSELRSRAISRGISADAIILDTGMGAFLGAEPALSWEIIRAYREFFELGNDMLLGCSRKGFLRSPQEQTVEQRDPGSALVALTVANRVPPSRMLYIRVHDPAIHHEFFRLWENCQ